jgi:hypothetical protein
MFEQQPAKSLSSKMQNVWGIAASIYHLGFKLLVQGALVRTAGRPVRRARILQFPKTGQQTGAVCFQLSVLAAQTKFDGKPIARRQPTTFG